MTNSLNKVLKTSDKGVSTQSQLLPLFETAKGYLYTGQVKTLEDSLNKTSRLYFPLETDTEFWHPELNINDPDKIISQCLTVQHRAVTLETGLIFSHPDSAAITPC